MNKQNLGPSLLKLVNLIEEHLNTEKQLSPLKAKSLVIQADVQIQDMVPYADFQHPVEDCYGRKLVYETDQFEVMVMSWNPGHYSSIHNHGYTQWGVVQVFGNTHHMIYNTKGNQLNFAKKEILPAGAAVKVNNAMIHQMGNATSAPYMTLHVYGANEPDTGITADAQNFDLELNRIALTCGGAFFNLPASAVHAERPGIKPTQEVFMHYAFLLMSYYNRQKPSDRIAQLKYQLLKKMEQSVLPHSKLDISLA